jgi:hypothetical protein
LLTVWKADEEFNERKKRKSSLPYKTTLAKGEK